MKDASGGEGGERREGEGESDSRLPLEEQVGLEQSCGIVSQGGQPRLDTLVVVRTLLSSRLLLLLLVLFMVPKRVDAKYFAVKQIGLV